MQSTLLQANFFHQKWHLVSPFPPTPEVYSHVLHPSPWTTEVQNPLSSREPVPPSPLGFGHLHIAHSNLVHFVLSRSLHTLLALCPQSSTRLSVWSGPPKHFNTPSGMSLSHTRNVK